MTESVSNHRSVNSSAMEQENKICKFQKFGFCKFGAKCFFRHSKEVCQNVNCAIESCLKRHPNPCKFFFLTRKCKFKEDCSYSHQFDKKDDSKEALEDKMVEVEELQNENQKLKNENEKLKKENDILIATIKDLENTTATLREYIKFILEEKEEIKDVNKALINDLEVLNDKFKQIPLEDFENENMTLEIDAADEIETLEDTTENFEVTFPCNLCNFTSNSLRGLNTHIGRKHKNMQSEMQQINYSGAQRNNKPMVSHMPIVAGLMD